MQADTESLSASAWEEGLVAEGHTAYTQGPSSSWEEQADHSSYTAGSQSWDEDDPHDSSEPLYSSPGILFLNQLVDITYYVSHRFIPAQ